MYAGSGGANGTSGVGGFGGGGSGGGLTTSAGGSGAVIILWSPQ
jgi:hypothetical protein